MRVGMVTATAAIRRTAPLGSIQAESGADCSQSDGFRSATADTALERACGNAGDPTGLRLLYDAAGDIDQAELALRALDRPDLPGTRRPREERLRAMAALLKVQEGRALEAMQDYRFLAATRPEADLGVLADQLNRFSASLRSREEGRRALSFYQSSPQAERPRTEAAFAHALEASRELDVAIPIFQTLQKEPGPRLGVRLELLRIAASLVFGEELIALFQGFSARPLDDVSLQSLSSLARRLEGPGWKAEGSWGVVQDPDRGSVWSDRSADGERRSWGSDLTSEPIPMSDLTSGRVRLELKFRYTDKDKCTLEAAGHDGRFHEMAELTGVRDWHPVELDLGRFSRQPVQLRFRSRADRQDSEIRVARVSFSGARPDQLRPLILTPEGTWGQVRIPERAAPVWTDSPAGPYADGVDASLTSEPIDLTGLDRPTLTFQARVDTEYSRDGCHVEVSPDGQEWKRLASLDGQSDWGPRTVDLSECTGKSVRIRFRMMSDQTIARDGVYLAQVAVEGAGPGAPVVHLAPLGSSGEGLAEARAVAQCALDRPEVLPLLDRVAGDLQSVRGALDLLPAFEGRLGEADLEEHRSALLRLYPVFKAETAKQHRRLVESRQPGEHLSDLAEVLVRVGADRYDSVRRLLASPAEPGLAENSRLFSRIAGRFEPAMAGDIWRTLTTPVAGEGMADRIGQFCRLLDLDQDGSEAHQTWRCLTRWVARGESLQQLVDAYQTLLAPLQGNGERAREAVRYLQDRQMLGTLAGWTMKDAVEALLPDLVLQPDNLEGALLNLIHGRAPDTILQEEEQVVVGGVSVPKRRRSEAPEEPGFLFAPVG